MLAEMQNEINKQGNNNNPSGTQPSSNVIPSETSIVTQSMKLAEEVDQINNAGMLPMDESGIRLKFRTAAVRPKHLDQVDKAFKFSPSPDVKTSTKKARKTIKPNYDNNMNHIMSHGYQEDFVKSVRKRDEQAVKKKGQKQESEVQNRAAAMDKWMKSRKVPAETNKPKISLAQFSNIKAKVNTNR